MAAGIRGNERTAGWLFVTPAVLILGLFLVLPILMALWVSLTTWNGQGSPFTGGVPFAGLDNYTRLFAEDGLTRQDFMTSIRNNAYYVLFVVPIQTVLALALALVVNNRILRGKGFFRTAFYFPSVTSSVAISVVFLFMFANSGAINAILSVFGISGPQWFSDPRGVVHVFLGWIGLVDVDAPPAALADHGVLYVMSQGNPAKTTLTPAFLSYRTAFRDFNYGSGAAIAFVLFLIIGLLTLAQRRIMRSREV